MAGCCEHGNEPWGTIIMRRLSSLARELSASQEALFSLQLLTECLRKQVNSLNLTFICPCIASISVKYNQQDATFSRSIYFYKLLHMFHEVPPPIIRSTKLYIQRQVLSKQHCCLLLSWMRWNTVEQFMKINRWRKRCILLVALQR